MTGRLRACTVLAEVWSLASSMQVRPFTATSNSTSRGSEAIFLETLACQEGKVEEAANVQAEAKEKKDEEAEGT